MSVHRYALRIFFRRGREIEQINTEQKIAKNVGARHVDVSLPRVITHACMKRPRLSSRLSARPTLQVFNCSSNRCCRGSFEKAPPSPYGVSRRRVPARSRLSASGQRVLHGHFWEKRRLRSREKRRVDRAVGARQSRLGPSGTVPVVHTVQIMRVRSVSRRLSPRRLRTNEATRAANASHPRSCSADLRFIARIPFPVPADHETFRRAGDGCARGGQARGARGPDERQGADEGFVKGLRAAPARCERGGRAAAPTRQGTARGAETG